jgi:YHS domain-containing protein/thiol-disulfide isomerase/thioredoxin
MWFQRSPLVVAFAAVLGGAMLAAPAWAQQESVHWHHDLESAKTVARQTNRLVLVHFWTTTCGPCLALDQNVFNQPGVGPAIEAQFVPVKLNADENSATAQLYGINRVPTDVVITPDGKLVGKLISPPTPSAYIAEVTGIGNKYATQMGQSFAVAAASAPVQPQINAAYAGLKVGPAAPTVPTALLAANSSPQQPLPPGLQQVPNLPTATQPMFNPAGNGFSSASVSTQPTAAAPTAQGFGPNTAQSVAPQTISNPAAAGPMAPNVSGFGATPPAIQSPITPIGAPPPAAPVTNPYFGSPPAMQQPAAPPLSATAASTPFAAPAPNMPGRPLTAGGAAIPSAPGSTLTIQPPAASAQPGVAAAMPGGVPDPRQLPPGAPPLGFDGYCPVSMRNTWKWIAGNPQYGIVHRGRTYWFAGPDEQKQFWTDPDRYTPALSGMDPVLAIDHQQQVPGKREHSLDYDGLFYMFASEATLQQFTANPQRYAANIRQAMGIPRGRLVR